MEPEVEIACVDACSVLSHAMYKSRECETVKMNDTSSDNGPKCRTSSAHLLKYAFHIAPFAKIITPAVEFHASRNASKINTETPQCMFVNHHKT